MIHAIKQFFLNLQLSILMALSGARTRLADERGDTNFISIAIVLIVVIAVAVAFIGFRDMILGGLNNAIQDLKDALGM